MMYFRHFNTGLIWTAAVLAGCGLAFGQAPGAAPAATDSGILSYLVVGALVIGLIGLIYYRSIQNVAEADSQSKPAKQPAKPKEKSKPERGKPDEARSTKKIGLEPEREIVKVESQKALEELASKANTSAYTRMEAERTRKSSRTYANLIDISTLPVSLMLGLNQPAAYAELPVSDDEDLLGAIEQCQEESGVDAEMRTLAIRILERFKTRNSVETLSQIALYDLSVNLRAKAVLILADFDHESVFDKIVLACSDPSREVRAAGAKALARLSFGRADAWARISILEDDFAGRQVVRAAVEAGIAERSLDRLIHNDEKIAYEAFALFFLMVKTGETEKIFEVIRDHSDIKIKLALLHVLRVANVADIFPALNNLVTTSSLPPEIKSKARDIIMHLSEIRS